MFGPRRPVRDMPQNRRHLGLTPCEIQEELDLWAAILLILQVAVIAPIGAVRVALLQLVTFLIQRAAAFRSTIWSPIDPVNPANKDRLLASWTDQQSWKNFRLRKPDVLKLYRLLAVPQTIKCDNGVSAPGQYAFSLMLYKLSFPHDLTHIQENFGREYSQLSRISNTMLHWMVQNHGYKVLNNLEWYEDRLDMYAVAINRAISSCADNPEQGNVPQSLYNHCAFLDCTTESIARIRVFILQL